ncbi:glycine betaine ABC transporter substrate-binding protein [Isoptericola sp. b441]|uniref:Glycine betaine ABC transporter substrate-binding protein n=1 Tax=Actinotalea lenta TaxID=3064654 RepID=A0ABT9D8I6_9CELL|nr:MULTISPECIES: glycine betaine ABC transporter substrate-binding protein [unclassified Isoptericola]MDO8107191.1 glycine betaine ABC transporter substrate-binding protein [Isoptericola sp. b441]MDO8121131.1 glycine betaine ABC transporter substrate-binding protein [Isoptericola sp. b490]
MRARRPLLLAPALGLTMLVAACGSPGSSSAGDGSSSSAPSGSSMSSTASGTVCEGVAGDKLVVLTDDQHLQQVDNIVPAVNATVAGDNPDIIGVLDSVSTVLDTPTLIGLNKSVDVDRKTSSEVAQGFVSSKGLDQQKSVGKGTTVVVGAPNFSEGATLAAIYADTLKAAGFDASTQTIGNRETYLPLLENGDLSVVPEYVGTLATFINNKVNGDKAEPVASGDLNKTMSALTDLGAQVGLVFGTPAAAQDQNAFAVTQAFADKYGVSSLSDVASTCGGGVTLGGPPECPQRDFCEVGLKKVYDMTITDFTSLDAGGPLTKAALKQGKIALGLVFSSDGSLAG